MAKRMPERKYAYFRDDQITMLITHPEAEINPDQLPKLSEKMKPYLNGAMITWPKSQIFSFPRATGYELEQQSGIINELKEHLSTKKREYNPSDYESELFTEAQDQSKLGFSIIVGNVNTVNSEGLDPSKLIEVIRGLREGMKDLSDSELTVKSVSPNWLMGNASQGGATGGPGGLPKPFKGTDQSGALRAGFNITKELEKLDPNLYGTGENVDVAILDTAPCPHDLVIAHKDGKDNPLIQRLLGPKGKLQVHWATYDQLLRMYNTSFNSHDYRMSDHGIFAAGIVHSIVPDATIHLIEVLNAFGVGDLLTLAEGFHTVFHKIYKEAPSQRKLVVNCSLMLALPIEEDHCYADERKDEARDKEPPDKVDDVDFEKEVLQLATEDRDTVLEINELCKKLFGIGKQVVAAAGNDWENGKARRRRRKEPVGRPPLARYPAAFASVVGVGALPKDSLDPKTGKHKTSNYSNLGDRPAGDGIMTLGGEEGETNGVLGLYLSDKFPKRERINSHDDKNTITMYDRRSNADEATTENNHWAWWSGTSFAAPILTGTIAAVLSSKDPGGNYQFDNTQRVIRALYTAGVISDGDIPGAQTTEAGEDVMVVTQ